MFDSVKRHPRRRMVKASVAAAAAAAATGGVLFASTAGADPLPTTARVAISMNLYADVNSVRINGHCIWLDEHTYNGASHDFYYTDWWVSNSGTPTLVTYAANYCAGHTENTGKNNIRWDGPMATAGGYRWVHISAVQD